MFKDIKQDYIEHNLNERLLLTIIEILSVLELIIGNIDFEETIGKLILYSDSIEKTDFQRKSKVRSRKGLMVHVFGKLDPAFTNLIFNPLIRIKH